MITKTESCNRCPNWTCESLSDWRSIMTTELASTFIQGTIEWCTKRLKELFEWADKFHFPIHNEK